MTSLKLNIDDRIASPRQQWSHNIVFCGPPNKASSGGCRYEWASRNLRCARGRSSKRFPAHFLKMQLVLKVFTSRKTRRGALKAKLFFSLAFRIEVNEWLDRLLGLWWNVIGAKKIARDWMTSDMHAFHDVIQISIHGTSYDRSTPSYNNNIHLR